MKLMNILMFTVLAISLCASEFYTASTGSKLSEKAEDFINSGSKETRGFVIYFTDKNVFDQKSYEKALSEVKLDKKTLKRRAKTFKRDDYLVSFRDLPVYTGYTNALGLKKVRAVSKWFNFISAEIDVEKAIEISRFEFVRYIDILPKKGKIPDIKEEVGSAGSKDSFYNLSYDQVNQINIPDVHDLGYHGEGARLLIIDTGFKKTHTVFDSLTVVDEWDFIFNDGNVSYDANDVNTYQESHGTGCWSIAAGYDPGTFVGPAYGSDFLLAKTEDYDNEGVVEEDRMVAALEWGEARGADVASISLGYSEFDDPADNYTYEDMDGETTICTLGAKYAAYLGMVVCNAMGNTGTSAWHYLTAPADADSILSCGSVDVNAVIASSSGYGPTYDHRIKPEVVARGVNDYYANYSTGSYSTGSGTSFATPLVAGVSCLLLSAHPDWTNMDVREALMMTADRASDPDSTRYGWGLVDALAAVNYVPLADPQNIVTSVSGTIMTVSWDAVTNAKSYLIYHSDLPYEGFTYLAATNQTTYQVNVTSATKKFYYIEASNQEMK